MENYLAHMGHLEGSPLRMFWGALRMTSVGKWLRFGCLGVLLSCSPAEGATDIALYLALAATVGLTGSR